MLMQTQATVAKTLEQHIIYNKCAKVWYTQQQILHTISIHMSYVCRVKMSGWKVDVKIE